MQLRKLPATLSWRHEGWQGCPSRCPVAQEAALGCFGGRAERPGPRPGRGASAHGGRGSEPPLTRRLWARPGPGLPAGAVQGLCAVSSLCPGSTCRQHCPRQGVPRRLDGLARGTPGSEWGAGRWPLCQQVPAQTCCEGSPAGCVALTGRGLCGSLKTGLRVSHTSELCGTRGVRTLAPRSVGAGHLASRSFSMPVFAKGHSAPSLRGVAWAGTSSVLPPGTA